MPHYLHEFEVELAYESDKLFPKKLKKKNSKRKKTKMYSSNGLASVSDFLFQNKKKNLQNFV